MTNELDALLTALYVEIDDHVVPPREGRGRRPRLTDAELVCLAVAQVLLGIDGEHRWMRFAYCRLGHLFRYLPKQPGYHKRLKAAAPLLAAAITHLARTSPSWCDQLRLVDATPLPCGTSRETVKRSDLAGWAGYGYCAAHSRFYWGLKLYLLAAPDGMPIAWCLADPKLGERDVCLDLLTIAAETGRLAPGATVLADKGLAGRETETQIARLGIWHAAPGPTRRTRPPRQPRRRPAVDRVGLRHPQGPTRPRTTRRAYQPGSDHPRRPAPARPRRRRLAQLDNRRPGQAQPHRLRPLNTSFTESII